MHKLISILSLCIILGFCSPTLAQKSQNFLDKTRGPFINIQGTANQFKSSIEKNAFGGGGGSKVGLSFKRFNIYLGLDVGALNNNYSIPVYFELGGQYNFLVENPDLIPYAETGFSFQGSDFKDDEKEVSLFGAGFFLGGGIKYFISPKIAFVTGLKFSYTDAIEIDSSSDTSDEYFFLLVSQLVFRGTRLIKKPIRYCFC